MTNKEYKDIQEKLSSYLKPKDRIFGTNFERGFYEGILKAKSILHSFKPKENEEE